MKKILNTLIGSLLLSTAASYADVAFLETFENPLTKDTDLATIAWHANAGTTAVVKDTNKMTSDGPILAVSDLIFIRPSTSGYPWLAWTDSASVAAIGNIANVKNISATLRNGSATEDLKIALKINDVWYVSRAVMNSPPEANTVINVAVHSVGWNSLNFVSGSTLSEGGSTTLPLSGTVQAIGVFDASTTSGAAVRVDNFTVQAIPNPATVGMVGISTIGLRILKRNRC
jgi:hypothetical protein